MIRLWHLILGLLVVFTAAHVYFGIPGGLAGLLRWPVLFGVAGIAAWITAFSRDSLRPLAPEATPTVKAVGLLLAVYFITAVAGFAVELSLLKLSLAVAQVFLLVYAANRLFTLREWYLVSYCFAALMAVIIAILFTAGLTGWTPIRTHWGIFHQNRLAVLSNPNSVAMVALTGGLFALWADRWPFFQRLGLTRFPLLQYAPWAFVGMAAFTLLWTASRTSQVAFMVGLFIWVLASRRNLMVVGGTVFIGIVAWLWRRGRDVAESAEALLTRWQGDELLLTRGGVWEESLRNWQEHPWFGHGFGVTEGGFEGQSLLESIGSVRDGSGYFGVLESIGIVGVVALLTLYGVVAYNLYRLAVAEGRDQSSLAWTLGMMGGTVFFGLAVNLAGEPWLLGPGAFLHITFFFALGLHIAGYSAYFDRRAMHYGHRGHDRVAAGPVRNERGGRRP